MWGSGSSEESLARTPTFLRPLDEEEHKTTQALFKGVVQTFNHSVGNDWEAPWGKDSPKSSSGTGFILSVEKRILVTNAHCVEFSQTLQVRREGETDKFEARVLACAHQVDLALVTVDDEKFWEEAIELELGNTPRLQEHVDVLGYPMGGEGISITSGVVSRVDWGDYSHSKDKNLIVTVDAAINSGSFSNPGVVS